jgi:hypothetical protein
VEPYPQLSLKEFLFDSVWFLEVKNLVIVYAKSEFLRKMLVNCQMD